MILFLHTDITSLTMNEFKPPAFINKNVVQTKAAQ